MNWDKIEQGWPALLNLCVKFHPTYTAPYKVPQEMILAEKACENVRQQIRDSNIRPEPIKTMELARQNKDSNTLRSICNEIWFGMPESVSSRKQPGFWLLCDICEYIEEA